MKRILFPFVIISLALAACSSGTTVRQSTPKTQAKEKAPSIDYSKVEVFVGVPENVEYEVKGSVSVDSYSREDAILSAKKEAVRLAGNAIINLKTDDATSKGGRFYVYGDIVKIKPKQQSTGK